MVTLIYQFLLDTYTYLSLLHIFKFRSHYYFDMKGEFISFWEGSNSPLRAALKTVSHTVRLVNAA